MAWTWELLDEQGAVVEGRVGSPEFPAQADAETWIGEVWPELAASGVAAVTLREDGRAVYGPMSLSAE